MSTRSRNRSDLSAARPPLVGRLHKMATTRPVPTLGEPEQARLVVFDEDPEAASIAGLFGLEEPHTVKVTQHPADLDPRYRGRQGR